MYHSTKFDEISYNLNKWMMNIHNVCDEKYSSYIERKSHEKVITYKINKKLADVIQIRGTKNKQVYSKEEQAVQVKLLSICTLGFTWNIFEY